MQPSNPEFDAFRVREPVRKGVSLAYALALVFIVLSGVLLAPGLDLKPLMACLLGLSIWAILIAVLVAGSAFTGYSLGWSSAAELISFAGVPVLFKLTGGLILALVTSLSPFLFSASPLIVFPEAPSWIGRFDVFEIWSLSLLWLLVRARHSRRASTFLTVLVWVAGALLAAGVDRWGDRL